MRTIPCGIYQIDCVLLDSETVLNNEGVRQLEILEDAWIVQPAEQRFSVIRRDDGAAKLESQGKTYFADFRTNSAGALELELKREGVAQRISIEAQPVNTPLPMAR